MDLTFYKNHESSPNRNRSLSCGSPLRNQVVYQEIYSLGQNTLVRSVSCNQIFSKDESGQTFETTQIQVSSFFTPEKKKFYKTSKSLKKPNLKLDESYMIKDYQQDRNSDNKKYVLKLQNKFEIIKKMCKSTSKYMLVAFLPIFICFYLMYLDCLKTWDIKITSNELQQNVYGQSEAIAKIKLLLNDFNKTKDLHTMIFTGSVGVGKTFVSSIIYKNFPWSSKNIFFLENFNSEMHKNVINGLSICGYNLIIFDDLTYQNVDEIINFLSELSFKKEKNVNIVLILIFQTRTEIERNNILVKFKKLYINYYHIPFQRLTEEAVQQCFLNEIKKQKAIISESELEKLVKLKTADVDVIKGPAGCKGIADEISEFSQQ